MRGKEKQNERIMKTNDITSGFRCIRCGFPMETLYIHYSPGNIRLTKCVNCKAIADEYIECEIMILIIDLILHKPKAYRHLFYNKFCKKTVYFKGLLWKTILMALILDIYRMWVFSRNRKCNSQVTFGSLLLDFGKMLTGVIFENFVFLWMMSHGTRKLLSASGGLYGKKDFLFVVLVSSYFKLFLLAMMVWEFPSSVIFIIDMFVMSSNIVALKVITDSIMFRCLAVCLVAHGVKFLAFQALN